MASVRHNEVHLSLPSGWRDASQVVITGPVDGNFRPNLVVSQEPSNNLTADKFAARQLPPLKAQLQGFALVKEGAARFGSHSGFLREHTFQFGAQKIAQLQFYVVRGPVAYAVTFSHLAPKLAAARKMAEDLFGKLSFE
jgi:hypothetical protein